jgi:hypothetical protein
VSDGGREIEVPVMEVRTLVLEAKAEMDTVGTTESAEFGNVVVVKVNVAEAGTGIIEAAGEAGVGW